ncbi:MAG: hypothetical protein NT080_12530 [Spirochaetes bacterium]|nr:hypothetical protein [Spirochaetota bacterium]
MKSKTAALFSALSVLVFASAIGTSAFRISAILSGRNDATDASFASIDRAARYLLTSPPGAVGERWRDAAKYEYRNTPSILSIAVRTDADGIRYMIPARNPYLVSPAGSSGTVYSFPAMTARLRSATFGSGSELISVDVLYSMLGQEEIFESLLAGFAIVGSWTAVCLVILLAGGRPAGRRTVAAAETGSQARGGNAPEDRGRAGSPNGAEPSFPDAERHGDNAGPRPESGTVQAGTGQGTLPRGFFADDVPPYDADACRAAPDGAAHPRSEPASDDVPAAPCDATGKKAPDAPDIDWFDDAPEAGASTDEDRQPLSGKGGEAPGGLPAVDTVENRSPAVPTGLYSPDTGLGWESYLKERLGAELGRSASFEQDLVLAVVLFEESAGNETAHIICAKTAIDFFGFRDLSFGHGERGFAFILPNIDIDHGIRMAEEFFKKATFILKDYRDPMSYMDLHIGLASRSGRLISADRLLTEAESALEHAKSDHDSHIVAFVTDADKYRSFISAT